MRVENDKTKPRILRFANSYGFFEVTQEEFDQLHNALTLFLVA